jgi:hypothetical protein
MMRLRKTEKKKILLLTGLHRENKNSGPSEHHYGANPTKVNGYVTNITTAFDLPSRHFGALKGWMTIYLYWVYHLVATFGKIKGTDITQQFI